MQLFGKIITPNLLRLNRWTLNHLAILLLGIASINHSGAQRKMSAYVHGHTIV
jgi:hypothetical protein